MGQETPALSEHTFGDWIAAYERLATPKIRKPNMVKGPCPICGGDDRFEIKRGDRAIIATCWTCGADFEEFLQALFPPDPNWKPERAETPPPAPPEYGCTVAQLAAKTGLPADFLRSSGCEDARCFVSKEVGKVPSVRVAYRDVNGKAYSWKHRVVVSGKDKYRYEKGSKSALFGQQWLELARGYGKLVVVEGETDSMTLWRHEIPAVGVPGCKAVKVIEPWHLEGIRRVFVVSEHGEAGEKFPGAVAEHLRSIGCAAPVLRVVLPQQDTNATYLADPQRFRSVFIRHTTYARGLRESKLKANAIISARELCRRRFPPLRHIIPGLLPEGYTLLFAAPKVGKSFMALQMAVAVARGEPFAGLEGQVQPAEVLVIDQEEPIGAEMKDRYLLHGAADLEPSSIIVVDEWPRIGEGGMRELDIWLEERPDTRLVVVDVWSSLKPLKTPPGVNAYDHDYNVLRAFRDFFQRRGVACVLVHHDKKGKDVGITETPSGSKALTGNANALLWLEREVGRPEGRLTVTGRSVMETELVATLDCGRWSLREKAGAPTW